MIALILIAVGSVASGPSCQAEHPIYKLRGAPGVTAGFTRQRYQINYASNLFFWVRTTYGRQWWFSMNSPNGFGGTFLSPDVDATKITKADREADQLSAAEDSVVVDFDMFDRDYGIINTLPRAGTRAPSHLFARGLGPLVWYNPIGAANGDKPAKTASIPIAM